VRRGFYASEGAVVRDLLSKILGFRFHGVVINAEENTENKRYWPVA
jgi:hypothetical protein